MSGTSHYTHKRNFRFGQITFLLLSRDTSGQPTHQKSKHSKSSTSFHESLSFWEDFLITRSTSRPLLDSWWLRFFILRIPHRSPVPVLALVDRDLRRHAV